MRKMITIIVILSIFFVGGCRSSKEIDSEKIIHDTKTGAVRNAHKVFYYMERFSLGMGFYDNYIVKNLNKEEIFYVKSMEYTTSVVPIPAGQRDPNKVSFFKIIFLNNKQTAEIPATTNGDLAMSFINDGLIVNGDIDSLAQERYILLNGSEFSKRANAINQKVIIVNPY